VAYAFYAWRARPPSQRSLVDESLGVQVRHSFLRSDRTYGARRVWRNVLEQGISCGLHRIARLMREQALRARPRRRSLPKDRDERSVIAGNVLNRQFQADGPNQKWVANFTYIWTAEGWLYVAAVLDLFSRRIVGWSMQESMTSQLVVDALMMGVWRRGRPSALPYHSDQGSPIYQRALPATAEGAGNLMQHEPGWRGLGQLGNGKLRQLTIDRTHGQKNISYPSTGAFPLCQYNLRHLPD
jgi:putative transposase